MTIFTTLFIAFGVVIFIFGIQSLVFVPLALAYEVWKKRFLARVDQTQTPMVSVIVPAYNEANTITQSLESILASDYPAFEVIVVNDGSTDATEDKVQKLLGDARLKYIRKANGGKASALNYGIREAEGEVVFYTDADSLFLPDTIRNIARWFADPAIDAVSGNDAPHRPETPLQKLLTITTHIGSGFVRRALSMLGVLPVISGNIGAVRKDILDEVGGFNEVWGEDLDLTFKLHKAGAKIIFDPEAMVVCDVPTGFRALWKQRVRWTRSFVKICAMHKSLFFNPRFAPFSFYLPLNYFNLVVIPVLQVSTFVLLPIAVMADAYHLRAAADVIAYLGYAAFFVIATFSILLDRTPRDLRLLPVYGWLIVPVSYFYNAVVMFSLWKEAAKAEEVWHKIERRELGAAPSISRSRQTAFSTATLAGALACGFLVLMVRSDKSERPQAPAMPGNAVAWTIATHFDAWSDPQDAIGSVLENEHAKYLTEVAVGAGRYEWNFFRWNGHEQTWSNDQKYASGDLLADAAERIREQGKKVVAIVDMYAPSLIASRPAIAAAGIDGVPSTEEVCFTELVEGEYGRQIAEMVGYLAQNYEIDAISITELEYQRFCYDRRCLDSFQQHTQEKDWPRLFLSETIDRNSEAVGEWRSRLLAQWLKKLANAAHGYGKKLYVDVPLHYRRLESEAKEAGLYYPYVLDVADAMVVWDYFYLDERSPKTSGEVARFLMKRYGPQKVIMSFGLWGADKPVDPEQLSEAVSYAIDGGATNLWITPNHLLNKQHWAALKQSLSGEKR